jgi:hypothetical protein
VGQEPPSVQPDFAYGAGELFEIPGFGKVAIDAGESDVGTLSSWRRPSITISPIACAWTSLSPIVSIWRWMPETSWSSRSCAIPRLRQAMATLASILARLKASRFSSFLTTVTSRSCTRSNVVKRAPQLSHWRRRRIEVLSSLGRLSFTWLSSCAQNGQRT